HLRCPGESALPSTRTCLSPMSQPRTWSAGASPVKRRCPDVCFPQAHDRRRASSSSLSPVGKGFPGTLLAATEPAQDEPGNDKDSQVVQERLLGGDQQGKQVEGGKDQNPKGERPCPPLDCRWFFEALAPQPAQGGGDLHAWLWKC